MDTSWFDSLGFGALFWMVWICKLAFCLTLAFRAALVVFCVWYFVVLGLLCLIMVGLPISCFEGLLLGVILVECCVSDWKFCVLVRCVLLEFGVLRQFSLSTCGFSGF